MSTFISTTSNLKGKEASREWDDQARVLLAAVLADTVMGKEFAWKAFVRNCHYQPKLKGKGDIHPQRIDESNKLLTLSIRAAESAYTFEVDLRTGRQDVPYQKWTGEVLQAIGRLQVARGPAPHTNGKPASDSTAAVPAAQPSAVAPSHEAGSGAKVVDLDRLLSLRNNIDRFLSVGKDLNEVAAMRERAARDHADAKAAMLEASTALTTAEEQQQVTHDTLGVVRGRLEDYERRVANLRADLAEAETRHLSAQMAVQKARDAYLPKEEALRKATEALKECEALEADRVKAAGEAKNLQVLIEALSKMGG